ncbi:MAG: Ig-like domain-containing protein [Gammaproteobacteria bacterium]
MSLRTLMTFLVATAISLTTQTAFAPPPPNTPPVANDDTATTAIDTPVLIVVLANDTDADGRTHAQRERAAHRPGILGQLR